jgi:hypothetical protein
MDDGQGVAIRPEGAVAIIDRLCVLSYGYGHLDEIIVLTSGVIGLLGTGDEYCRNRNKNQSRIDEQSGVIGFHK